MSEPRAVHLSALDWERDVPGIRDRATTVDGARWAIVEYAAGAVREEWCEDGHRGFVVDGEIEYEFSDGRARVRAGTGDAFVLPSGIAHRGRNLASGATTMFLIDDAVAR
jgi:quercetin dioxygenase-like cupin family protein